MPDILEGINTILREQMRADDRVVILGEDIEEHGGAFGATKGLWEEFGESRVFSTPPDTCGTVGTAIGMALYGLRPVPEISFVDFVYPAFGQIVSELAKYRYRSAGQYSCPLVIRAPYGSGVRGGPFHSASPEVHFAHTAGLNVVVPSTPGDAAGLLRAAISSDDPVIFLEPKGIYHRVSGEIGEGAVPLGCGRRVRDGDDVTVVAYGSMVPVAMAAAEAAGERGVAVDLVDLRSLLPLDVDMLLESVARTGRLVIVHEAPGFCGYGSELAAIVSDRAILQLEAPVVRVTGFDTPVPYALEDEYVPDSGRVLAAIQHVVNF